MKNPVSLDGRLLEPRLLRLFDALFATGSVTIAAERLGENQPTVSMWLARLRRDLDDPLFVRTPQGMLPTPRAQALIGTARQALESLRRLAEPHAEFDPARAERRFHICMTDASHITLLPQILGRLRSVGPGLRVDAVPIDATIARRLMEGEADLAIGLIPDLESGFFQQRLYSQDFVCLANRDHPRIRERISRAQYEREGHVDIASGTGYRLLDHALAAANLRRDVVLELPGFLGLASILAATDLVATLPRHIGGTLAETANLRVLACPFPIPTFEVKQHWHERFHAELGRPMAQRRDRGPVPKGRSRWIPRA